MTQELEKKKNNLQGHQKKERIFCNKWIKHTGKKKREFHEWESGTRTKSQGESQIHLARVV